MFFRLNLKPRKLAVVLAFILTVFIAVFLYFGFVTDLWRSISLKVDPNRVKNYSALDQNFQLAAVKQDTNGVDPRTSFILTALTDTKLKVDQIQQNLTITPKIDVDIKPKGKKFEITPKTPLDEGQIYRFNLAVGGPGPAESHLTSWAFQVKGPLKVVGSYPRDASAGVRTYSSIEIYFNQGDFNLQPKYFAIKPNLEGRWEKYFSKAVFVAKNGLKPETKYTVTVKKGLALQDGSDRLDKDYTFSFTTVPKLSGSRFFLPTDRVTYTKPSQPAIIKIYNGDGFKGQQIKLTVVELSLSEFKNCLTATTTNDTNCSINRQPAFNLEVTLDDADYLRLPQAFGEGYYLVTASQGDLQTKFLMASANLSWYFWLGTRESLFWFNDLATGQPVKGVQVKFNQKDLGTSDAKGFLKIKSPADYEDSASYVFDFVYNGKTYIGVGSRIGTYTTSSYAYYSQRQDQYWSYIYVDRRLYQPDDKLSFWGLVKPRDDQKADSVLISLSDTFSYRENLKELSQNNHIIFQQEIKLSPDHTFKGSFDWQKLPPGDYYVLVATDADSPILSNDYVDVRPFTKQDMYLQIKPAKRAVIKGDKIDFTISTYLSDGTPIGSIKVDLIDSNRVKKSVTTDATGQAKITMDTSGVQMYSSMTYIYSLDGRIKLDSAADVSARSEVLVYASQAFGHGKSEYKDNQATIEAFWYRVDESKLDNNPWSAWQDNPWPSLKIQLKVEKKWYDRQVTGQRYDPYKKQVVPIYKYIERRQTVKEEELTTDDTGRLSYSFETEADSNYIVTLMAIDDSGRQSELLISVYTYDPYMPKRLVLKIDKDDYQLNQPIQVNLTYDSQPLNHGRSLFVLTQLGRVLANQVSDDNQYQTMFKPEFIPNVYIKAIWFSTDGYLISSDNYSNVITFDAKTKQAQIEVKPDKDSYQPGDKVKLNIKVTSPSQKPSRVLVSVIDEAIVRMSRWYWDGDSFFNQLYQHVSEGMLDQGLSFLLVRPGGAEGGGGGGVRENFQNTAFFDEVATDNKGRAAVEFKLPDDITTWRVTVLSVNQNLEAGNQTIFLTSGRPLVVRLISPKTYIVGDQPVLTVGSTGQNQSTNQEVVYKLKIDGLNYQAEKPAKLNQTVEFDLPRLEQVGRHEFILSADLNGYQDGIKDYLEIKPAVVTKTAVKFVRIKDKAYLKDIIKPEAGTKVDLKIIDQGKGDYYNKLKCLAGGCRVGFNQRLEVKMARNLSAKLLSDYFDQDSDFVPSFNLYSYYDLNNRLFGALPQDSGQPELTAKILAANLGDYNLGDIINSFYRYISDNKQVEPTSLALWGLAEAGQPVLNLVYQLDKQINSHAGQIYLALAASSLGDYSLGSRLVNQLKAAKLKTKADYRWLDLDKNKEYNKQLNGLAMILAARIGRFDLANDIYYWLSNNMAVQNPLTLDQALMIKAVFDNLVPQASQFEYNPQGQVKLAEFKPPADSTLSFNLYPEYFDNFFIKPNQGQVGLLALYQNRVVSDAQTKPGLGLQVKLENNRPKQGDKVKLIITPKFTSDTRERLILKVVLPSGLRYFEPPRNYNSYQSQDLGYWLSKHQDQVLEFTLTEKVINQPIIISTYAATKGEYRFLPILLYTPDRFVTNKTYTNLVIH